MFKDNVYKVSIIQRFRENIYVYFFIIKFQSLGNHEFDDGVEGLIPFLNKATFPVLVANLNLTNQPGLAATKALKPSTILDVEGTKVGVIGYLTSETGDLSLAGNLIFAPEIDAIK